ncbi:MAG: hypothetical protein Q9M25_05495 [Mariprofundaceae bacterium]|nr:hypothetical protein [Mariprofundaceae bacterium]
MKSIMMRVFLGSLLLCLLAAVPAFAVTKAEDVATTIMLRGQPCGGNVVSNISERKDAAGNTTITATCPNGQRYRIDVTNDGRVSVTPIR